MITDRYALPMRRHPVLLVSIVLLLAGLIAFALLSFYDIGSAFAQGSGSAMVDAGSAGSGSAVVDAGSAAPAPAPAGVVDELKDLQAKYNALRAAGDKDPKALLWAAMLAAAMKILLSIINMVSKSKPKKWMAWIAMGLAVPIALLSHYAVGHTWFDSLVFAGAGPGAVIVHELLKAFTKSAPAPAMNDAS